PWTAWVDADRTRIVQIVSNLLGNAEKFTPRGGSVTLSLERQGSRALVRVRDDGVGMEPEILKNGFQPFHHGPQTVDRSRGGRGLGLATVKGLVEAQEGSVEILSDGIGQGTEVRIRLPIVEAPPPAEHAKEPLPECHRRVLVIDDNRDAAESLA